MAVNELNKLDLARLEDIVNANRLWFDQAGVSKALAIETLKDFLDSHANVDDITIEMGTNDVLQIKAHSLDEGYFTTEFNARLDAIETAATNETNAREAADETLQDNIDAEALTRAGADDTLQNNIDAEELARTEADTALDGRLDTLETNNTGVNTGDETEETILTKLGLTSISGNNTGDETVTSLGAKIQAADQKTPNVDSDLFAFADSADSWKLKKITWSQLKANIQSWLNSLTTTFTNKTMSGSQNTFSNINGSSLVDKSVTRDKIENGAIGEDEIEIEAVSLAKIKPLGNAKIISSDGSNNKQVALSGDVTMNNNGVVTIGNEKITSGKLANELELKDVTIKPLLNGTAFEIKDKDGNTLLTYNTTTKELSLASGAKFVGDGSALSGITGATGGISNTGSTNIIADSNVDGSGDIVFSIGSTEILRIKNNGSGNAGVSVIKEMTNPLPTLTGNDMAVINRAGRLYVLNAIGNERVLYQSDIDQDTYYNIGTAGGQDYGVGIVPDEDLPSSLTYLEGTTTKGHANYGNYKVIVDDSIMVCIPAFYYKVDGNNITTKPFNYFLSEEDANANGYALPRAFIDGGQIKKAIFIDKYKWSLTNAVEGVSGIASSIKNSNPISSSPATKRWRTANISGAVAGSGIVTITSTAHGFKSNNTVTISGVVGMTDINGTFVITVIDANSYTIPVSTAQTYTSGGVAKVANYPGSFSNCISNGQTPADNYGGAYSAAKSRGSDFFVMPIYVWQVIQILQQAHAQASTSSTYCAWYDATGAKNYPKGNNNYGADTDESGLTYANCTDDYWKALPGNEAKQNGGASNFAKTTHNGQECGIADINGNQFDILSGFTCKTTTYTTNTITGDGTKVTIHTTTAHGRSVGDWIMLTNLDSGFTDKIYKINDIVDTQTFKIASTVTSFTDVSGTVTAGTFYILKNTFQIKNLTGGTSSPSTDMFNSTFLSAYCDIVIPDFADGGVFAQRHGNGTNQVLEFSTSKTSNSYKKASALLPKANGVSTGGTNQFGLDFFYQYITNDNVPIVAGYWNRGSTAGVFSLYLSDYRTYSGNYVSGRSCLYVN